MSLSARAWNKVLAESDEAARRMGRSCTEDVFIYRLLSNAFPNLGRPVGRSEKKNRKSEAISSCRRQVAETRREFALTYFLPTKTELKKPLERHVAVSAKALMFLFRINS